MSKEQLRQRSDGKQLDPLAVAELEKIKLEVVEMRARLGWEAWLGRGSTLITSLILVGGFVVGLWQYRDTRAQEYKRDFWQQRLEVYSGLVKAASRVATLKGDTNKAEREKAFQKFEEIYHGTFILITDDSAALAAKDFYQTYLEFRHNPYKEAELPVRSRSLAISCRAALAGASEGLLDPGKLSFYP